MDKKITDLERFALEQVYRPYQSMLTGNINALERLGGEYRLDNVIPLMEKNPEWKKRVLDRINACKFYFPTYIKHPLVDYIKSWKVTSNVTITSSDMENMPSNRITNYDHEDEIARELANGRKE